MPIADFAKYPNVKVVNINATIPIVNVTPQLYGYRENVKMTISDILKCLMRRAIIHEVMPDGSTIRLDLKNFRDDNRAKMAPKEEEKKEEVSTQELSQTAEEPAVFVTGMSVQTNEEPVTEPVTETASNASDEEAETIDLPTAESSEEPTEQPTATSTKTTTTTRRSTKKKSTKK